MFRFGVTATAILCIAVAILPFVREVLLERTQPYGVEKSYFHSLWRIQEHGRDDHIIIDVGHASFQSRRQIMALTSNSAACENTRSVEIRSEDVEPLGFGGKLVAAILDVKAKVPKAIACLKNVHNVSWTLDREPLWLADRIMETIASLPSLSEFTIKYGYRSEQYPSLHPLTNLTKLILHGRCGDLRSRKVDLNSQGQGHRTRKEIVPGMAQAIANSPELKYLHVDIGQVSGDTYVPTLHDLFSNTSADSSLELQHLGLKYIRVGLDASITRHLHSLTSFEWMNAVIIKGDSYANSTEDVWQTLKREGIKLTRLRIQQMNDDVLQFLSSYQGLRELRLEMISGEDDDDSNRLANIFFRDVLPKHANSVEILRIAAGYGGDWCFGKHNAASILNCTTLKQLETSVYWPRTFQWPETSHWPGQENVWTYDPGISDGTPVHFLLNSTSQLPHLHSLRILTGGYSFLGPVSHVYEAIFNAVDGFETQTGDTTRLPVSELRVGWQIFKLREGRYHKTISPDSRYL